MCMSSPWKAFLTGLCLKNPEANTLVVLRDWLRRSRHNRSLRLFRACGNDEVLVLCHFHSSCLRRRVRGKAPSRLRYVIIWLILFSLSRSGRAVPECTGFGGERGW